jgi:phage terminase small subunit
VTDKQTLFVAEFLVDFNATQAAIRAGYSAKTARSIASENLSKPDISRAIAEAVEARSQRCKVDADYVTQNLTEILERCKEGQIKMRFDPVEKEMVMVTDDEGRPVWEFDSMGANKAAELLGKSLGMFTDRIKHDFSDLSDAELLARAAGTFSGTVPTRTDA